MEKHEGRWVHEGYGSRWEDNIKRERGLGMFGIDSSAS
jgi:hypothetical protein